ncbi:MAG: KaiC domain-containing protein [Methanoculleaceae archaeon]
MVQRVRMGIEGLDSMLGGGLIPASIAAIVGTYGTGKTTFATQFVFEGLHNGENAIYISLEERKESILAMMRQRGLDVDTYLGEHLHVIKLDPTNFNLSINSIKNELPSLIEEVGATRVVIDPISLFEGLFPDAASRRTETFRFIEMMRDIECNLLLTSETSIQYPGSSRYGLIEYLVDTVILLRYIRPGDVSEVHLVLEVVKMRGSAHSREIKPFEILPDRINVYSEASIF